MCSGFFFLQLGSEAKFDIDQCHKVLFGTHLYPTNRTHLMKSNFVLQKIGFVIALVSASIYTQAKTFTAVASGDWSSNATWQGSDAPGNVIGAGDQVIISTGLTVDLNSDIEIDGLLARLDVEGTLNAANNSIQTIDGTVSGSGTITSQNFWIASAGNFSFDGDLETDEFVNQSLNLIIFADVTVQRSGERRVGKGLFG